MKYSEHSELVNSAGYWRHVHLMFSDSTGTWSTDIDPKDYDPALDEPYRVIDLYQIPIFDKYRLPSATAELARAAVAYRWPVPLRHH